MYAHNPVGSFQVLCLKCFSHMQLVTLHTYVTIRISGETLWGSSGDMHTHVILHVILHGTLTSTSSLLLNQSPSFTMPIAILQIKYIFKF